MKIYNMIIVFSHILVLIFFNTKAHAKENICNSVVSLAFYEIGYLYFLEGDTPKGIDKDFIDELANRTNCIFKSTLMVRARIWKELENYRLSATVSGISTPER